MKEKINALFRLFWCCKEFRIFIVKIFSSSILLFFILISCTLFSQTTIEIKVNIEKRYNSTEDLFKVELKLNDSLSLTHYRDSNTSSFTLPKVLLENEITVEVNKIYSDFEQLCNSFHDSYYDSYVSSVNFKDSICIIDSLLIINTYLNETTSCKTFPSISFRVNDTSMKSIRIDSKIPTDLNWYCITEPLKQLDKIVLNSHSDKSENNAVKNSQIRAELIKNKLIQLGFEESKIGIIIKGNTNPLISEKEINSLHSIEEVQAARDYNTRVDIGIG